MRAHARLHTAATVALLTLTLLAGLLPGLPPQRAAAAVTRLARAGRVETAVAVAARWDAAADVVLADAGNFPDALAAGSLAASLDAPLLLTPGDALPAVVAGELARLGTRRVHIMGGPAAVSAAVEQQLADAGYGVARVAGPDRFATAAAAARAAGAAQSGDVVVALGGATDPARAWPDALSAGAFAATADRPPLLLVAPDQVPATTEAALAELAGPDGLVSLIGGEGAIAPAVEERLGALGLETQRLAGPSRFTTSLAAAQAALRRMGPDPRPLVVASGANFPDGLSAAALAAHLDGVLALVPPTDLGGVPEVQAWVAANAPRFSEVLVVGGTAAADATIPLPDPAATPASGVDEVAEGVAAALASGEGDMTPEVLAVLTLAGFTVLGSDGAVETAPADGAGNGLAVEAWEAATLGRYPLAQREATLAGFGEEIAAGSDLDPAEVTDLLLADLRGALADPASPAYPFAATVAALGRHAPVPHDLAVDAPGAIRLTVLQTTLIGHRLAGELQATAEAAEPAEPAAEVAAARAGARLAQATPSGPRPCTLTGPAATILDLASVLAAPVFGELIARTGTAVTDRVAAWTGRAGVVLAVVQALIPMLALDIAPTLDGSGPPLERTTSTTTAGEQRTLTTTVRMNVGDAQIVNCLRFLLNGLGLDFSLPNDGPFEGALVDTPFLGPGFLGASPLIQGQRGETFRGKTADANGQVGTLVEGRTQPKELTGDIEAVLLQAPSRVDVTVKPASLYGDLKDAGSTAVGVFTGGLVSSAVTIALETVQRTSIFHLHEQELRPPRRRLGRGLHRRAAPRRGQPAPLRGAH